jgi:hypothetical protein
MKSDSRPMNVEEEHLDVLQNIEFAMVRVCQRQPALVDFDVENALTALMAHYQAQVQQRTARLPRLNERAQQVYDGVESGCEWRLGNAAWGAAEGQAQGPRPEPVTVDVIVACLRRIRKSVQRWNREGGRQGYLTFIQRFMP